MDTVDEAEWAPMIEMACKGNMTEVSEEEEDYHRFLKKIGEEDDRRVYTFFKDNLPVGKFLPDNMKKKLLRIVAQKMSKYIFYLVIMKFN